MSNNKFVWETYEVPRRRLSSDDEAAAAADEDDETATFTIRHLKQGATGAVKTWPAAEVLLEYLVQRGGLRDIHDKIVSNNHIDSTGSDGDEAGILDFNNNRCFDNADLFGQCPPSELSKPCNILELGGGTGYLSVGLALALNNNNNNIDDNDINNPPAAVRRTTKSRRVRLMCTDNNRATIKNMRHNISNQPPDTVMNKTVRIESLDWGSDVGGEKFSRAVRSQFQTKRSSKNSAELPAHHDDEEEKKDDAIRLLSHVIASDVHYGETTLGPLSSVISAIKIRHPDVIVILLLKERRTDSVSDLKEQIEAKVKHGVDELDQDLSNNNVTAGRLHNFSVSVRDVLHRELPGMKMVEC